MDQSKTFTKLLRVLRFRRHVKGKTFPSLKKRKEKRIFFHKDYSKITVPSIECVEIDKSHILVSIFQLILSDVGSFGIIQFFLRYNYISY